MKSMTGYGRGAASSDTFAVNVELKTVNSRFLDVLLKLGSELQSLEPVIKRRISERLARGRIEVSLQSERTADVAYELDRGLIRGYVSALKEMQDEFGLTGEPDLNVVARLPNVMTPKRSDIDATFVAGVEDALSAALDDLEQMRSKEGELLAEELAARLATIESLLPPIVGEIESVREEYHQKLTKRIGEIMSRSGTDVELDQSRLAQEVAYMVDRSDISEEIARLTAHITHFREIMTEEKEVGKRLDFLTQELNREANTIASKSGNLRIKENALRIKSEIEKIREQVQNVE